MMVRSTWVGGSAGGRSPGGGTRREIVRRRPRGRTRRRERRRSPRRGALRAIQLRRPAPSIPIPQPVPLQLARRRTRQRRQELDPARVLVGRDLTLHEVLQLLRQLGAGRVAVARDDEGGD